MLRGDTLRMESANGIRVPPSMGEIASWSLKEEQDKNAVVERLIEANTFMKQENELFKSYFHRHGDEGVVDVKVHSKGKKEKRKRQQTSLNIEQKHEIASSEYEELQKDIEETKVSSERLIDTLRAVLEETDTRISELKKDAYEFKRDIVVGAENFRSGKTMAEKVIKYMEEKLRQKDAVIEKMRLKNATLKSQIQKVDAQLKQKEEMGDVLHYIDFHQLQIENKQYVARIEERNQELLKLKMTTGNTVQVLNNLKKKLGSLISESEWLKREIKSRTELLSRVRQDNSKVGDETARETHINRRLRAAVEDNPDMPHVRDYINQKAEAYELKSAIQNWERKCEIRAVSRRL